VSDIQMGLVVSVVGLTVTFLALSVFIGVIVLLQKLFPVKPEETDDAASSEIEISENTNDSNDALVAALAAAVYIRSRRSGQLGATLLAGPGPYRSSRK
jgi:sodium pump decarboxylase gamma subunit